MSKDPKFKKVSSSKTTPLDDKKREEVKIKVPKTENIIFIGSELSYDSFWLKMMFIASAYAMVRQSDKFRAADKKTIAYVAHGYSRLELSALEVLRGKMGFELVRLNSSSDVVNLMNKDRSEFKLQDVAFFSHGVVDKIRLNYQGSVDIDFDVNNYSNVGKDAFAVNGRIYSFACRTGVSVEDLKLGFKAEADAKPELSLAQKMADHFGVDVHAFLRRTFYGDVIREKSQSGTISAYLKKERESKDGQVVQIPPDHEALPHAGLADSWNPLSGPKREGTDNYTLWRKLGGIGLPTGADTPAGLSKEMRVFKVTKKSKEEPKTATSGKAGAGAKAGARSQ